MTPTKTASSPSDPPPWLLQLVLPSARVFPFIATDGDLTYLQGGKGDTEPETLFIYCLDIEDWTRCLIRGLHPPAGLIKGGCAISDNLYGGIFDKNCFNYGDLYELNTWTWQWKKLSDGSAGGLGKKYGCRMISYQDQFGSWGNLCEHA